MALPSMYILGLSAMGHDSAAALLGDSGVAAAIEEGKLARTRGVGGIPRAAIHFCLERAGISWRDVAHVAIASDPARAWRRQACYRARVAPFGPVSSGYFLNKAFGELGRELNNFRIVKQMAGAPAGRVEALDHHFCHAASAFFASPFDKAVIVSLDERGDGRAGFVGIGEGARIREVASIAMPNSLAWAYSQVTKLLGFRAHGDEHKTQWLSLVGEPVFADLFLAMLRGAAEGSGAAGAPRLDARYFRREFGAELAFTGEFYRRVGIAEAPEPQMDNSARANIAASLQRACETILCEWLAGLRVKFQARSLCLAGGLFLNPLLAAAIESRAGFENVFVQPAAGNEGTALGAAGLVWHREPAQGDARVA
ncbi:MAG: carbamoyltransferase N-terminal domain-containing protein, partial [Candidatus Acidiferrales bacterium]